MSLWCDQLSCEREGVGPARPGELRWVGGSCDGVSRRMIEGTHVFQLALSRGRSRG